MASPVNTIGILVCGDNHLILGGVLPGPDCARALARRFGLILVTLGGPPQREYAGWTIRTREFREQLAWAVHLGAEPSPAVRVLLDEMAARGVRIYRETDSWEGAPCD